MIERWGQPSSVAGPKTGKQTWEYDDAGLSIVLEAGHVVHYIAKKASSYKTSEGITIGSDLTDVTKKYGETIRSESVEEWFTGYHQNVLYHHPGHAKYKINYHDHDVIFHFDQNKKVESIGVGYIYPKED